MEEGRGKGGKGGSRREIKFWPGEPLGGQRSMNKQAPSHSWVSQPVPRMDVPSSV